ncbi:MAG: hypothetical protein LPL29_02220 [Alphaproteobacteria bacterium]|nr:hypothetical protein [Alphaproteobacteria bacterium]
MADDIRQNFGSFTGLTFSGLDSLANGSGVVSSAVDLGSPGALALTLRVKLDGNSASNTDFVEIYVQWGDGTDFADAGDGVVPNDTLVGVAQMNGTGAVVAFFPVPVEAQHFKVRVKNASGDALAAAGNSIAYMPRNIDQV